MSCKLEPAIWSCDTGQRISFLDRCQLITTWMSNIRGHSKPRLHVSVIFEYGRHVARHHCRRHAYAPTSNTASHDNHEKINSWVSFCFPYEYKASLGSPGCQSSAINNQCFDYFNLSYVQSCNTSLHGLDENLFLIIKKVILVHPQNVKVDKTQVCT